MALMAANLVERYGRPNQQYRDLLEQLDQTMFSHHRRLQQSRDGEYLPTTIRDHRETVAFSDYGRDARRRAAMHWANFHCDPQRTHPRSWNDSFLSLAVHFGLRHHLEQNISVKADNQDWALFDRNLPDRLVWFMDGMNGHDGKTGVSYMERRGGRPLLMYALAPHLPFATVAPYDLVSVETVRLLLDNWSRPNRVFEGRTCWQEGLEWLHRTFAIDGGAAISDAGGTREDVRHAAKNRLNICHLLLDRGADTNAAIDITISPARGTSSVASLKGITKTILTAKQALKESFASWVDQTALDGLLARVDGPTQKQRGIPELRTGAR
ncbi:uncharacterized protein B0I36DRAFT_361160 [Microdochium trichocladiopsis]|uniref:Ankyrin repeat-containing domain protein n=1 Tax=Microdochium trichocladiopsis TaxID=1682393 RepID=A0A9P9BTQ1_9PEZI|nr:uncharacterized protein B0I36DRAFT_361160 [Microdochium trichocladiopsis]KAH7035834.1 hypothetical protein B0I36DRAFT_361160 [Microdochium trichocladiopsis]